MNSIFIQTKNVKKLISLISKLKNTGLNMPKMGLVFGTPGLGKTQSLVWIALRQEVIIVTGTNQMTPRWFLRTLVQELGEIPQRRTSELFEQAVIKLMEKPKMLIIDEIDYLINNTKTIETIRDLHDRTGIPVLLAGMGAVDKKLSRYKHFFDRIIGICEFKPFDFEDVTKIINTLSEIPFEETAIEVVYKYANRFRQLVNLIQKFEDLAKTNDYKTITKYIVERELCRVK